MASITVEPVSIPKTVAQDVAEARTRMPTAATTPGVIPAQPPSLAAAMLTAGEIPLKTSAININEFHVSYSLIHFNVLYETAKQVNVR